MSLSATSSPSATSAPPAAQHAAPATATITVNDQEWRAIDLPRALAALGGELTTMPYVIRILLENLLRSRALGRAVSDAEIDLLVHWREHVDADLPLYVARVILPDSSGLPVLQDLAALRNALARAGGDPARVDTRLPVDLIVDHSLQVDTWGHADAKRINMSREFERNAERYAFLGWAQQAFRGLRVFPPGSGIIHQVNLERIATVVASASHDGTDWAFPDFVIGGDSHTPMVNGIGVLGWGVGGIDAEAALLGQAYTFPLPAVVGVRLVGQPAAHVWTTDIALLVNQRLRAANVTACAVEFFGPAAEALAVPERATLANMAPEYGATCGFFPVDERTLAYLAETGRSALQIELVRDYCTRFGLFRAPGAAVPAYDRIIEIDISAAEPSMAGPQRPQDRLPLADIAADFRRRLALPLAEGGFGATRAVVMAKDDHHDADQSNDAQHGATLPQGAVVIAAITSCTNTSNPQVMLAAGLAARNAVARGLHVPPWVKTSLAPGSPAVIAYLEGAGLLAPLARLGFHLIGFGCTTCGGKSGPLAPEVVSQIEERQLVTAAVLSGNRNFPGRIHKLVRANYIGAPPLVVAYALAGRIDIDLATHALGVDSKGQAVFWRDILPDAAEVQVLVDQVAALGVRGASVVAQNETTSAPWFHDAASGTLYPWDATSQYLREPPFFAGQGGNNNGNSDGSSAGNKGKDSADHNGITALAAALQRTRVLCAFGDSLTTDHISPSSEIPVDTPAGQYLIAAGIAQRDFNTFVGRRGNFEVMARGTFANVRLRNALTPDREGGWTLRFPERTLTTIFDAAQSYLAEGTPVIVLAGKEYGTGSSRDWAAKGSALLGVKAVIAESYERIHRANLIGMGVLPLRFRDGQGWRQLGLTGDESYRFAGVGEGLLQGTPIRVSAQRADGSSVSFEVDAEVRTTAERQLMAAGGIPNSVLQDLLTGERACA